MEKGSARGRGRPPRGDAMKDRIFVLTSPETQRKLEQSREISGKTTSDLVRLGLDWAHAVLTGASPEILEQLEAQLRAPKEKQAEREEGKAPKSAPAARRTKAAPKDEGEGSTELPPKSTRTAPEESPKRPLPSHLL